MRIATSTLYDQQTSSIDDLNAQYADIGAQVSSGIKLNEPSDDPSQIASDLGLRTTIAQQTTLSSNIQSATGQLTSTDSALANLTSVLQSARSIAVQGASSTLTTEQRSDLGSQVDQLFNEAVSIANTQYGGTYVFAGTSSSSSAPVTATGSPATGVTFSGNNETQGQIVFGNQSFALSTTMQQAFNYQSADGSADVFSVLASLRDSLTNGSAVDESGASINAAGQVIQTGSAGTPSTLANAPLATALTPDNGTPAGYAISIAGSKGSATVSFAPSDTIDDGNPSSTTSVVGLINAQSATTGVTASFDQKTQRLVLTGAGGASFTVSDVPTPGSGATTSSNFTSAFGLAAGGDTVDSLSTQIGDVDNVLNVTLSARTDIGERINTLSTVSSQNSTSMTDNQQVASNIEDVDVAQSISQLSQVQTALQAAYETTTKLEGKSLLDYLT